MNTDWECKYFKLLDITMNLLAVHELSDDDTPRRRQIDRLVTMFREQIDEEVKNSKETPNKCRMAEKCIR